MSVQTKAIKAVKATSKKTTPSKPATKTSVVKPTIKKTTAAPVVAVSAPVASAIEAKAEKKFTEADRLAKRWRRATYGADRTKYAKDAFAISREYVSGALKTLSVMEVEAHIETIKRARKQSSKSVAVPSGAIKSASPVTKTSKPSSK